MRKFSVMTECVSCWKYLQFVSNVNLCFPFWIEFWTKNSTVLIGSLYIIPIWLAEILFVHSGDKNGERIMSPQLDTKFHFPANIDEVYMKFCLDLIMRDVKGEKIDYAKESTNFWNRKMKKVVESRKESMKKSVC